MRIILQICRAALLPACVLLAACQGNNADPGKNSVFANGLFSDLTPKDPNRSRGPNSFSTGQLRPGNKRLTQDYPAEFGLTPVDTTDASTAGQYTLNFENTDIKEVAHAILNDALHVNYTISGDVSGPVTISSARPVSRDALLSALEASLSSFNFSLVKSGDSYRITANGMSVGTLDRGRITTPGYGVSIIPLKFVQASTMSDLISGFVAQAEGLKVNIAGNMIIVRGSGPQRAQVVDAVSSFDADFMQNQRVSIFRLVQAKPEDVVPELERIFNVKGENGLIQFQPMSRIRGVMAISKNPALIRRAETWARRLDQEDPDTNQNVVIYKAKYRKSDELARVLTTLFTTAAATTTPTTSTTPTNAAASSTPTFNTPTNGQTPQSTTTSQNTQSTSQTTTASNPADRIASAFSDSTTPTTELSTGPNVVDLTSGATSAQQLRISSDPTNNSVVIYGDSELAAQALATLKKLDATPTQVSVNVTIAEVRLNNELKYGVQYFLKSRDLGLGRNRGSLSLINQASNAISKDTPGLNFVAGADANPDVIISALNTLTDVEVLSAPTLVVLENQTATLQVGDEVPITTQQSQSTESGTAPLINSVEFKDTGIILNVTPRIGQNDAVTMDIDQEISNVVSGSNTLTPTISKRSIKTQISVNNQQTVLLGGLISATTDNSKSGVPGLMRIPVVGDLFSSTSKTKGRTELIIMIRPVVIRDAQDAADVAENLRSQMSVIRHRSMDQK